MNTELFNALMKWDKWGGTYKRELYNEFSVQKNFATDTTKIFVAEPLLRFQTGWLLREFVEQKNKLPDSLLQKILEKTDELEHWWSKASVLRIITLATDNKTRAKQAEKFVRENLKSEKIAIKALSIQAFGALAALNKNLQAEAITICQDGLNSDSAAIFVKSRDTLKKLTKEIEKIKNSAKI